MLDAGRLAVYRWVAPLAMGRTVLDVGCGSDAGRALLSEAAGQEIAGVNLDALAGARVEGAPGSAGGDLGETGRLMQADASFQLVVAIGTALEQSGDNALLDELFRVTAPDGLLLLRASDGTSCEALRERLRVRFGRVTTARSRILVGSGISPHDHAENGSGSAFQTQVHADGSRPAGQEVLLLGGDPGPVELPPVITLEGLTDTREWIDSWVKRREAAAALRDRVHELEQRLAESDQLRSARLLAQATLGARIATYDEAVGDAVAEAAAMFEATLGWRVTAPLRRAGDLGGRRLRRAWHWAQVARTGDREL